MNVRSKHNRAFHTHRWHPLGQLVEQRVVREVLEPQAMGSVPMEVCLLSSTTTSAFTASGLNKWRAFSMQN